MINVRYLPLSNRNHYHLFYQNLLYLNRLKLLKYLRDSNHTIILEIDPLINELSVRRLQFYERSGYTLTPYRFVHLPYRLDGNEQELLILSYPNMITKEQHNNFLKFLNEEVIKYCEGYDPDGLNT